MAKNGAGFDPDIEDINVNDEEFDDECLHEETDEEGICTSCGVFCEGREDNFF